MAGVLSKCSRKGFISVEERATITSGYEVWRFGALLFKCKGGGGLKLEETRP